MSELFKFRSKAEAKKPYIPPIAVPDSQVQMEPSPAPDSDFWDDVWNAVTQKPAPTRTLPAGAASFDLDNADTRIKFALNAQTFPGEQFRFLRTRLSQMQRQQGFKKLLVTSTVPGEGKTFISCCLAPILAQEPGRRIILVDADLRRPSTGHSLGMDTRKAGHGLSQVLQNTHKLSDVLLNSSSIGLSYLPAGQTPGNPSELLASDSLDRLIRELTEMYDWTIIDSPPVLSFADASRIASLCDTVLLVVGANSTPVKLIQKSIQMIGTNLICGIVLNRAQNLHPSRGYYYRYYTETGQRVK